MKASLCQGTPQLHGYRSFCPEGPSKCHPVYRLSWLFIQILYDTLYNRPINTGKGFFVFSHFSRVRLCVTPRTVARQALCPWGFPRQEYWSGLPCPPSEDLPNPGIEPRSPTLQADSLSSEPPILQASSSLRRGLWEPLTYKLVGQKYW